LAVERAVVFREVTLNNRKLEGGEDCGRRLALEKELEAPCDEVFHVFTFSAIGPPLDVGTPDRNRMPGTPAGLVDGDIAQPTIASGYSVHLDRSQKILLRLSFLIQLVRYRQLRRS
jgi:hypothetical protein